MTSAISLNALSDFFGDEANKMLKKGENLLLSNHVVQFLYDAEWNHIQEKVHASQRDCQYSVKVELDKGKIIRASCECVRGRAKCGHISCILLYANRNLSVTDTSCRWSNRSSGQIQKTEPIDVLYPKSARASSFIPLLNFDETAAFSSLIGNLSGCRGGGAGVQFLFEEEANDAVSLAEKLGLPDIETVVLSTECQQSTDLLAFLSSALSVTRDDVQRIAATTTGQNANEAWHTLRRLRLTASHFGAILKFMRRERRGSPAPFLLKKLLQPTSLDGVHAIMWGRNNEGKAIRLFQRHTCSFYKNVKATGLWLHTSGALGASPDGLVGEAETLEVKCPYKWRNCPDLTTVLTENEKSIIMYSGGCWQVNKEHEYYDQIQAQLLFTKRSVCNLVVYADKSAVIHRVSFDDTWAEHAPG